MGYDWLSLLTLITYYDPLSYALQIITVVVGEEPNDKGSYNFSLFTTSIFLSYKIQDDE